MQIKNEPGIYTWEEVLDALGSDSDRLPQSGSEEPEESDGSESGLRISQEDIAKMRERREAERKEEEAFQNEAAEHRADPQWSAMKKMAQAEHETFRKDVNSCKKPGSAKPICQN